MNAGCDRDFAKCLFPRQQVARGLLTGLCVAVALAAFVPLAPRVPSHRALRWYVVGPVVIVVVVVIAATDPAAHLSDNTGWFG